MKKERLEDLGIIYEKLNSLIERFEEDYPYFDSKHSYDNFQKQMTDNECDKLYEFHCRMRSVVDHLNEIIYIARGDIE